MENTYEKLQPFFYASKNINKQFNRLSLSIISSINNNIFILCNLDEEHLNKLNFLINKHFNKGCFI